jgi:AbrB family looped-hinge helix DNA binding protein
MAAMGVPAAKVEPEPLVSARVKVRPKAQLTLPEEIRRALHISEGDEVEFAVHGDGTITVRGYVSIPTDQAWFFTPQWLAGEREADEEIAAGQGTVHESADAMFAHLDSLTTEALCRRSRRCRVSRRTGRAARPSSGIPSARW